MFCLFCYLYGSHDLRCLVQFYKHEIIAKLESKFEFQLSKWNLCLENQNRDLYSTEMNCIIEIEKRAGKFKIKIFHPKFKFRVDKLIIIWYNIWYDCRTYRSGHIVWKIEKEIFQKKYWHTVKCVVQYKQFRDEQHFKFFVSWSAYSLRDNAVSLRYLKQEFEIKSS